MHSDPTRITARSRQQAMDWSLVLASQDIRCIIEEPSENAGWSLLVSPQDSERAFRSLRLYQKENRGRNVTHPLPWVEERFDWLSLGWAALLIMIHWLASVKPAIYSAGILNSNEVRIGQWWRLLTAITLHKDVAHLAGNLSIGIVLIGLAMGRYGSGTGSLAAFVAGICGNLACMFISQGPFEALGASGMVMGALGLLAARSLSPTPGDRLPWHRHLAGFGAAMLLFIMFGLDPGASKSAHLGGFVGGLGLGILLSMLPHKFYHSRSLNAVAGMILAAMVAGSWWLAWKNL